jgi:hypothetical protein
MDTRDVLPLVRIDRGAASPVGEKLVRTPKKEQKETGDFFLW